VGSLRGEHSELINCCSGKAQWPAQKFKATQEKIPSACKFLRSSLEKNDAAEMTDY